MSGPSQPWVRDFRARVRTGFVPTTLWTTLLTGLFFVGYLFVQRHPAFVPVTMPRIGLDLMIPFQPLAIVAYVSIWIYVGVGPGLQRTRSEFAAYGVWICALCATGLGIFYFWPTQVPAMALEATRFPGFEALRRVDEAGNACPSMHVAVAIFTAMRIGEVLRAIRAPRLMRVLNVAWFAVIVYSTLAIKQHVVLDVLAGALLGAVFALMSLRWRPGLGRQPAFEEVPVPP
jgi:membrane-associated phospholipid phosphatase